MQQLILDYNLTQEELGERIGKSRSLVANTLRLLSLESEVIKLVANNKLSAGHARTIITLPKDVQVKLANKIVADGLSVRDTEQEVKDYFNPKKDIKSVKKVKMQMEMSAELKDLIVRMQQTFKTKVSLIGNEKKGRVYIDYYTRDDLDRLLEIVELLEKQ